MKPALMKLFRGGHDIYVSFKNLLDIQCMDKEDFKKYLKLFMSETVFIGRVEDLIREIAKSWSNPSFRKTSI